MRKPLKKDEALDKKAKQILFRTYWKNGWIDTKDRTIKKEDFEYAKSKGLMFEPFTIHHDKCIEEILFLYKKISSPKIYKAFLSSLSTRRLDLRSALSSYFFAQKFEKHKHTSVISGTSYEDEKPKFHSYTCKVCRDVQYGVIGYDNYENEDLNVLNFERIKWGGVRHGEILYTLFDLQQFEKEEIKEPTEEDIDIFKSILKVIETSDADDYPSKLEIRLKDIFKSNKAERQTLIEILAAIDILKPQSFDRPIRGKNDWTFVEYWRGEDKYDKEAVSKYFGEFFKK